GPAGGGDVEGLLDGGGELVAVLDEEVVLGRRAGDAHVVRFLERVVADEMGRHLSREGHEGNGVHERVLQSRHEVGGRGPGGDEADPRLARGPRVALRCMPRRRLLAYEDVAQALEVVQDVVDRQYGPAGQAEDGVHALTLQTLEQDARA